MLAFITANSPLAVLAILVGMALGATIGILVAAFVASELLRLAFSSPADSSPADSSPAAPGLAAQPPQAT